MLARIIIQTLASVVFFLLLLLLPAGSWTWPEAWICLALFEGCSAAMGIWLWKTDPALLAERMTSAVGADQKPRDRAIMIAMLIAFCAWFIFMGLDARFGWSHAPLWTKAFGAALIVGAFYAWALVLRENSFASTQIRLQPERGQTVISTGPYALVRHPMYAAALPFLIGTALLLGSFWGLLAMTPLVALLTLRILGEETMLREGLPGYGDYATKVRFRMVPRLW